MKHLGLAALILTFALGATIARAGAPCPQEDCDNGSQCSVGLPPCQPPVVPAYACPQGGPYACWDKTEGTACPTDGTSGGRLDGTCTYSYEAEHCLCYPAS
jgi:hypothetical protein